MQDSNVIKIKNNYQQSVLTLGTFDGLHLGHIKILDEVKKNAQKFFLKSIVFAFAQPPRNFFAHKPVKVITLCDEKEKLIKNQNIDVVIIEKFDSKFAELTAEEFVVGTLIKKYKVKTIVVGENHRLGKNKEGDCKFLNFLSKKHNFDLIVIPSVVKDGIVVSSSNIRKLIEKGEIETANSLLNYSFFINGTVVEGNKIGRDIGFPTANLSFANDKIIPKEGVYAVVAQINDKTYPAMCNIGFRPTLNFSEKITLEVHILNFNNFIYNQDITLNFIQKIRDEIKFENKQQLINQLITDKKFVENLLVAI